MSATTVTGRAATIYNEGGRRTVQAVELVQQFGDVVCFNSRLGYSWAMSRYSGVRAACNFSDLWRPVCWWEKCEVLGPDSKMLSVLNEISCVSAVEEGSPSLSHTERSHG